MIIFIAYHKLAQTQVATITSINTYSSFCVSAWAPHKESAWASGVVMLGVEMWVLASAKAVGG